MENKITAFMSNLSGVYLITDTTIQKQYSHQELAEIAVETGISMIQYRDKNASARESLETIKEISQITTGTDTTFIVNDRADLALAGDADGVHLGQDDLPIPAARTLLEDEKIIGGTSSNLEEALQVEEAGADYVALGHIFETTTKQKSYAPRGLGTLREVAEAVSIPLVAIGGITLNNAPQVIEAGADVIALSSAICAAEDPRAAAQTFVDLF
ncbi:thiamine phosphate synthase [Aliifodinibius sp. S!AR15-10]|uniref:thiamine phosphate synthase n=1 Tax=Aliifodinibius sp. S!AR15-10 TaxID=2950437 RepID=UPI002857AC20|nr:thiamine phosphate synthase [Aliifodinibius sp. S!AR15-10]MDR8393682.1 thiamine phosphate synthase [Aliifodinibius sp. S!AR15-10]